MPTCAFAELERRSVQRVRTYTIEGRVYNRIPYGTEPLGKELDPECPAFCGLCGVRPGQLHIPGCEGECCPKCWGHSALCDCDYTDPGDNEDND